MSDPRNPVMVTVGWATATVLTTGATAPLLGSPDELLGVPASTVAAAVEATVGGSSTIICAAGSTVAGPMVLHATPRSLSSVASRRA